jgi:argininosuccinate lyase
MRQQKHTEYRGYREPGIRLMEPLAANLRSPRSQVLERRLYAYHLFDKAHLVMLVEEKLVRRADGVQMLRSLREMEHAGIEPSRLAVGGGMHSGEQWLIRKLGEDVGGRIHLGRSSGDCDEVGRRVCNRDQILNVIEAVICFRSTLIHLAKQHLETIMPGYTQAQHAQPTTWAHWILSWVCVLERDTARLFLAFNHQNRSPAGAVILTGSDFPLNRHRVGDLLGFDAIENNTFDAILSHDNLLEVLATLTILHMNLARWADDLMLFSTSEFGFIDFPDRYCGSSSIMMQKKNAIAPQNIKGGAAESVGGLMAALMIEKGPTAVPVIEHESSDKALINDFDGVLRDLGWMNELMSTLKLDIELMRRRAGEFWATASEIAGTLVREKDLPWRSAHQIIGIVVRYCEARGVKPADITPEMIDEAAVEYMGEKVGLSAESLQQSLDPTAAVRRRTLFGGPAPSEVRKRLAEYERSLASDFARRKEATRRIQSRLELLEQAIDSLLA